MTKTGGCQIQPNIGEMNPLELLSKTIWMLSFHKRFIIYITIYQEILCIAIQDQVYLIIRETIMKIIY